MITALEEHNGTLAERLAATQKELDALRANYANLSDINLEKERECDELRKTLETAAKEIELLRQAHNQATARAEAAEKKTADKQAAIDAFGLALIEGIATQEAGTAAATNPPAPAPSTPSTHTANLIARPHLPHDAAITALERQANGSNGAATNHEEPADATEEPAMTFDWSHLPLVYQTLINPCDQGNRMEVAERGTENQARRRGRRADPARPAGLSGHDPEPRPVQQPQAGMDDKPARPRRRRAPADPGAATAGSQPGAAPRRAQQPRKRGRKPPKPLSVVRQRQQRAYAWRELDDEQKKQVIEDKIAAYTHWLYSRDLPTAALAA